MVDDKLSTRVLEFQKAVSGRDPRLAKQAEKVIDSLVAGNYPGSDGDLLKMGVKDNTLSYWRKVLFGDEPIQTIVENIPKEPYRTPRYPSQQPDRGEWDGSKDNATRRYEGG